MSTPGEVRTADSHDIQRLLRDALAEEERRLQALEERVKRLARGDGSSEEALTGHPPGTWDDARAQETLSSASSSELEFADTASGWKEPPAAAPIDALMEPRPRNFGPPSDELEQLEESLAQLRSEGSTEEGTPLPHLTANAEAARQEAAEAELPFDLPPDPLVESEDDIIPFDLPPDELIESGEWEAADFAEPKPRGYAASEEAPLPRDFVGIEEPRPRNFQPPTRARPPALVQRTRHPASGPEPLRADPPFEPLEEPRPRGFRGATIPLEPSGPFAPPVPEHDLSEESAEELYAARRLIAESGAHLRELEEQLAALHEQPPTPTPTPTPRPTPTPTPAPTPRLTSPPPERARPERYGLERAFGGNTEDPDLRRLLEGQSSLGERVDSTLERLTVLEETLTAPYEIDAIRRVEGTLGDMSEQLLLTTSILQRLVKQVEIFGERLAATSIDSGTTQKLIRLLRSQPAQRASLSEPPGDPQPEPPPPEPPPPEPPAHKLPPELLNAVSEHQRLLREHAHLLERIVRAVE